MSQTSADCPECPKRVEIKFSTGCLLVHDTPEGVECEGSGWQVPSHQPEHHDHQQCTCSLPAQPRPKKERKGKGRGGSVRTVSGGLPGLGKRK
jgi:hypothetical protein